jgi:hypothetical protein
VEITVNIVGFTLKGRQVQDQLTALAEGTGGHYYSAQSGDELARTLLIAAADKFAYAVFDASGAEVTAARPAARLRSCHRVSTAWWCEPRMGNSWRQWR